MNPFQLNSSQGGARRAAASVPRHATQNVQEAPRVRPPSHEPLQGNPPRAGSLPRAARRVVSARNASGATPSQFRVTIHGNPFTISPSHKQEDPAHDIDHPFLKRSKLQARLALRGGTPTLAPREALPARPDLRHLHAYTRTDLIVTLAILTILTSVGLAAATHVRRKARIAQCLSSLSQVNRAVLDFSKDSEDTLPSAPDNDPRDIWWWYKEQVRKYTGLSGPSSPDDRVFACPDDRGYSDPKPFHQNPRFDFTSYVFNGVTLPSMPNVAGWKVHDIVDPKQTLLVMEWTAHGPLSWHRSRTGRRNLPFYNNALSVLGFVDGHVQIAPVHYDGHNAAYTRDPAPGYAYRFSGK